MYNNILLGRYFPVKSKMHDMDPFAKMLSTIIFIITLIITNNLTVMILMILVCLIMMLRSNVPLRLYFKGVSSLSPLILIVLIVTLLINVWPLFIIFLVLKIILIILYTSILTFTSTPTELTYGFQKVLAPLKLVGVPTSKLALKLTLAIRYIPILFEQAQRIIKTQASRGVDFVNSKFKRKVFAFFSMLKPLFRLANMRSRELAQAMELRMYTVYNKRTSYRTKFWGAKDTFIVLLHVLILAVFITKEILNQGSLFDNIVWDFFF